MEIENAFSPEELHYLGMNFVGKELEEMGYEFLGVNSDLKKHPQFVLYKKDEKITFVMVKTSLNIEEVKTLPEITDRVVEYAKSQDSNVWYIGVALVNSKDKNLPVNKTTDYSVYTTEIKKIL